MRVLITGGHFSPAHSIITELLKRHAEVSVAGRKYSMEGENSESYEYMVCRKEGIPFYKVRAGRFPRKLNYRSFYSLGKIPVGFFDALKILNLYNPDIVITFGGYVALPVSYAAFLKGVPVMLHEQTQHAGLAAKLIGRFADKICISFESSKKDFEADKCILTGNPIREEVFRVDEKLPLKAKGHVLYFTGGSTGSHAINKVVKSALGELLQKYTVIHQTGENKFLDYERLVATVSELPVYLQKKYIVKKFILPSQLGFVFKSADLVVSRAGANTLFELLATHKVSLLIPLQHGQKGEQLENAELIKSLGVGDYIEEKYLTTEALVSKITQMFSNSKQYLANMESAKKYVVPNSAQILADIAEGIYEKKSGKKGG